MFVGAGVRVGKGVFVGFTFVGVGVGSVGRAVGVLRGVGDCSTAV